MDYKTKCYCHYCNLYHNNRKCLLIVFLRDYIKTINIICIDLFLFLDTTFLKIKANN